MSGVINPQVAPPSRHGDILARTISGLEAGLRVDEIAEYDLETCLPDDDASEVIQSALPQGFDQVPVAISGDIVGVLECDRVTGAGPVSEYMRPIDGSLLISAAEPITRLIETVVEGRTPYRLVVRARGIEGIVTRSDLLKLPVRLLAFSILAHFETMISNRIRNTFGESEEWLDLLGTPSLAKSVRNRKKKFAAVRFDLPLIEVTYLREKVLVLSRMLELDDAQTQKLDAIVDLRNTVGHDRPLAVNPKDLVELRNTLDSAMRWIEHLGAELKVREDVL